VAWLALNSAATVIPVAILGTRTGDEHLNTVPRPGRRLHVSFGPALTADRRPGETGRASMDRVGTGIRAALARHVQDTIQASGHRLPAAEKETAAPEPPKTQHERQTAVAGEPADHHLRKVQ